MVTYSKPMNHIISGYLTNNEKKFKRAYNYVLLFNLPYTLSVKTNLSLLQSDAH